MNQHKNYRYTVLIIEKDDEVKKLLSNHLNKCKYSVLVSDSAEQANVLLKSEKIDFILVDIKTIAPARLSEIMSGRLPVIVTTEAEDIQTAIDSLNNGACSFILKPIIDLQLINPPIEKCIKIKRKNRQDTLYTQHLEEELRKKTNEIERKDSILSKLNKSFEKILDSAFSDNGTSKISDMGHEILEDFGTHLQASGGSIYMCKDKGLRLVHTIEKKHTPDFIPYPLNEKSPFKKVLESGKSILVNNIDSETEMSGSGWGGYEDSSFMIFPLPDHNGNVTGVLSLHNKTRPPFVSEDREMGVLMSAFYKELGRAMESIDSLNLSESKYEHLTENSAAIIFSFNVKSETFDFVNSAFNKLTGLNREEIIGKGFENFIKYLNIQENADVISHFESMMTGRGSSNGLQYQIKTAEGELKWVFQQTAAILDVDGFPVSIDGIISEFSEQKEAEEELKSLVRQKDLLLSEINHRVKNNLQIIASLINLQHGLENDKTVKTALETAKSRIVSMAMVHDNIYDTDLMPTIVIKNYIEKLFSMLLDNKLSNDKIKISLDLDDIEMDLDRAVLCGLIINEAVSNAFIHAFNLEQNGKVSFSFKTVKSKYIISITDDGRGFNPDSSGIKPGAGLGIDIMNNLIKQLDGTIDFNYKQGTSITIRFPIENTRIREELL